MIAKTLALTLRSIREDARLLRTHLFRVFLLGVIFWFLVMIQWESMWLGAPGLQFFQAVTWLNFVFITLGGIGFFSSAITEEKEEMTLGLLRMAGIGPMALLSGKLIPRLLGAVLLLSAQFPFTLLAITLGGVSIHQVTAAYCTLVSYTLLLAGVAVLCSVIFRRTSGAALATTVAIALFVLVPWWFAVALRWVWGGLVGNSVHSAFTGLYEASPVYQIDQIMSSRFSGGPISFQAITNAAAAVVLFLLSWGTFDLFNRDEQASSPARGLLLRSSTRLRNIGGRRVWRNALFWKDYHFLAGGPLLLLVKFFLYLLLAVGVAVSIPWFSWRSRFDWEDFGGALMFVMLLAFLVEGAVLASRVFQQEVKWKTLPALMMLPVSLPELAYSKIAGCLVGLLPSAAWFFIGALIAPDNFGDTLDELLDEPGFWFTATQYVVILHLAAFLSLFIKWAALPMTVGIVIFTNWCCLFSMYEAGNAGGDGPLVVMSFLGAFAALILHFATAERLRSLAAR